MVTSTVTSSISFFVDGQVVSTWTFDGEIITSTPLQVEIADDEEFFGQVDRLVHWHNGLLQQPGISGPVTIGSVFKDEVKFVDGIFLWDFEIGVMEFFATRNVDGTWSITRSSFNLNWTQFRKFVERFILVIDIAKRLEV